MKRARKAPRRRPTKRNSAHLWGPGSRYYGLAEDRIHREDLPAHVALNKADQSGDRAKIARAEKRVVALARSRAARVLAESRAVYELDLARGADVEYYGRPLRADE